MRLLCALFGRHKLAPPQWLEGKCVQVQTCKRCDEAVATPAHRPDDLTTAARDPTKPCLFTTRCERCDTVLRDFEDHNWGKGWVLVDKEKNVFERRCARGHSERKHQHVWVDDGIEVDPIYDDGYEVGSRTWTHQQCKFCPEKRLR